MIRKEKKKERDWNTKIEISQDQKEEMKRKNVICSLDDIILKQIKQ